MIASELRGEVIRCPLATVCSPMPRSSKAPSAACVNCPPNSTTPPVEATVPRFVQLSVACNPRNSAPADEMVPRFRNVLLPPAETMVRAA